MASVLVRLYETTDGETWKNNTNWLRGEPCVDGWYGVYCCPDSHPVLADWPQGGCQSEDGVLGFAHEQPLGTNDDDDDDDNDVLPGGGEGVITLQENQIFPAGCASGNSTGDPRYDEARCVIVALLLGSNGLDGALAGSLDELPWLQVLG